MSWKDILKSEWHDKRKKEKEEKRKKIQDLNTKIRNAHKRLSRQISIDPRLESTESKKLIRLLEILAKKQDELHEE